MTLQQKTPEFVLGFSMKPDELYSLLVNAIASSSRIRMVSAEKTALKARFAWMRNERSEEYHFDLAISSDGNLCDIHILPASPADSRKLDHAVASVVQAISSYGDLRVIEANGSTMLTNEPSSADVERIGMYLEEQGIVTLGQISKDLGISELTVDIGLHRLMNNGVIGQSPSGYVPERFYFRQQVTAKGSGLVPASTV